MKNILHKITVGKILKYIVYLLIFSVYLLLIGRIILSRPSGDMKKFIITDTGCDYENAQVLTQELGKSIDKNGYFHISNLSYIKNTKELQITVRYNNSTIDKLEEMYGEVSDKGEIFVFTITDSEGNVYDEYRYEDKSNLIYNFRRLVFDNIDFGTASSLRLNVYYINDATSTSPIYTDFLIYDKDVEEYASDIKFSASNSLKPSPTFLYVQRLK